jgi:(2S)-methylsuccinyl-CoA dehydrogenase
MSIAANRSSKEPNLVDLAREATGVLDALLADATANVRLRVSLKDEITGPAFDREQRATHGLAWLATYVESVRQLAAYAERIAKAGKRGETYSSSSVLANISLRYLAAFR